MTRLSKITFGAVLQVLASFSVMAQASEPANPFKDLKAAAEAVQALKADTRADAPVSLPPPPAPGQAVVDSADVGRVAQMQVLAVVGSSALLAQGGATGSSISSTFEVQDMKPALVGGLWIVPVVRDGQVKLYRRDALRLVKGIASLAPDAVPVFDWRGGFAALGGGVPADEAPRVVGPEAFSPSKRSIRQ